MANRLICCLLALALSAMAPVAMAGSFSVAPTRVELTGGNRTAVVTLRNAAAAPLTVQVSVVAWAQDGDDEVYSPTRDLLATPPVFTVGPEEERVVRIALRRAIDPAQDLPYRIFFEEVPQAPVDGFNGVNIALRVGVPIFVKSSARTRADLHWEIHPQADGRWRVEAINQGTAHMQVTGFDLTANGAPRDAPAAARVSVMKYVLPHSRTSWTIDAPAGLEPGGVTISGLGDRGDFRSEAGMQRP